MNVDPSGHFAISSIVLALIISAVVATVVAKTICAVADETMVLDFSVSLNSEADVGYKARISIVLDFKNDYFELYGHQGITYNAKVNTVGFSYSPGIIINYKNLGDYSEPFNNFCGSCLWGIDHCYDHRTERSDSIQAYSITFSNNK